MNNKELKAKAAEYAKSVVHLGPGEKMDKNVLKSISTDFMAGYKLCEEILCTSGFGWVSVSDYLPEVATDVLCVQKGNESVLMAHYCENGFKVKKYVSEGDRVLVGYWSDVTHWHPLAKIPANRK